MSNKKKVRILVAGEYYALEIGSETIPISGHKVQGSRGGATELCVRLIGTTNDLELEACLECLRAPGKELFIVTSKAGHALKIGSEMIPVSGYKIQRAADGTTEFSVTITGFSKDSRLKVRFE